jgi:hypothetical protein
MHASVRRAGLTFGILAAIFVVASVGAFFVSFAFVSSADQRAASPPLFKAAAGKRTKNYRPEHPEHGDQVKRQLRQAIITITSPEKVRLGQTGEITLRIEHDKAGVAKASFPRQADRLTPVEVKNAGSDVIRVYYAQLTDWVTTELYESTSDTALPCRDEKKRQVLPEEAAAWTWHVAGAEPGARALEFQLATDYTVAGEEGSWPVGVMAIEMPVNPSLLQWVGYYLAQVAALWQYLVGFAGGIVGVTAAWPIVRKLVPATGSRKDAPDAQAVT